MRTLLFIIVLAVTLPFHTFAQKRIVGGLGSFNVNFNAHNTDALGSRLHEAGYSDLQSAHIGLGGSGYGFVNNFVIGGEGYWFGQSRATRGNTARTFGGGVGFLDLGYVIYSSRNVLVYPVVGIGGGGAALNLQSTGETPSFNELIGNPPTNNDRAGATVTYGSLLGRVAVNADYFPRATDGKCKGFFVGLSAGYKTNLSDSGWTAYGSELSNAPDFNLSGFYATLKIGGGFWKVK